MTNELIQRAPAEANAAPANGVLLLRDILRRPLPHLRGDWLTRWMIRGLLLGLSNRVVEVRGLARVTPAHDPFILALNHSQKLEALLVPAMLAHHRQGKLVHFLADWNFKLIPGIALVYRCGQVITIDRKPARPLFLNALKPWLTDRTPGFTRARLHLEAGRSIGIFPEGTVNRDPRRLFKGHSGAARLSLETGVPVIPVGIRFPKHHDGGPISAVAPMVIEIGEPLLPNTQHGDCDSAAVLGWHETVMRAIAQLSHKEWQPHNPRRTTC